MKAVYSSKIRLLMQNGIVSHVNSPSPIFTHKSFLCSTRPFPSSSNISSSPTDSSKQTVPLAPPLSKEKIAECFHCSISQNIHELSKKCSLIKTIQQQLNEKYNLFEIFHIPISYFIDEKALDMKYKQLQKNLHPDHYIGRGNSPEVVKNATDLSSAINYAFQTLKSPVLRAEYLYWLLFKKNVFEEGKTIKNPQLMMEMFEWREKISDATSVEEKKKLIQSIEDFIVDVQKSFEQALQKRDAVSGMELAVRLNYYHKMLEELDH